MLRSISRIGNLPESPFNNGGFRVFRIKSERQFVSAITLLFSAIIGIGLWRHEMWRDEYHAWGLVLNSNSLAQMLGNLRGEGHLPFSYIILYGLSRLTENPHSMQLVQFVVAVACAYLLLRFAPFQRWEKVLLLSGYFLLYEYGIMSRSYTWDVLGLFGFCAAYGWRKEHQRVPWLAWVFLLIMATNESFGLLMAIPLAGLLVWDLRKGREVKSTFRIWAASIATVGSILLGYLLLRVITLSQWASLLHRLPKTPTDILSAAITVLGRAVLPKIHLPRSIWDFPAIKAHFVALQGIWQFAAWIALILIVLVSAYCLVRLFLASVRLPFRLYRNPPVFTVWASGSGLLFLFLWSIGGNVDDARHSGHFYLFFIACWWLSCYFPNRETASSRWISHVDKHSMSDLRFLLFTHLIFGLFAYCLDIAYPFSANQSTAAYIKSYYLQHAALVAPEAVAIAMGKTAYFPQFDMEAKVLLMRDYRRSHYLQHPTTIQMEQRISHFIRTANPAQDVVIVTREAITDATFQKYFRWQSPPSIIDSEEYFLYYIPQGMLESGTG